MGDFTPVIVAVITSLATVVGAALGAGWFQRRKRQPAGARWRDQAELEHARAELLATENADLRSRLGDTQHDLDDCARQRDQAWSDLRVARRRGGQATS